MSIKFLYPVTYDEYTGAWNICIGGFIYTTLGDYYVQ